MFEVITSLQNPRVKNAAKLRDRKGREEQERIIIDGVREIAHALDANVELLEAFYCPELCTLPESEQTAERAERSGAVLLEVTPNVFAKVAFGERTEGLVAVARPPRHSLADLTLGDRPLIAVLEGVEKPGNIGAVVRSADAAGVSAVIVADGRTDLFNPNAIRASLGAMFTLPVCAATGHEAQAWLRSHQVKVFAARVDGATDYTQCDFTGPCAVVLGSENAGLSEAWRGGDVTTIALPMLGASDSLNVSATAAVIFYEALRQRRAAGLNRGELKIEN